MSRSMSVSSSSGGSSHHGQSSSHLPPWERRDIPRVPYMGPKSPGLTHVEQFEVQPWTGQSRSDRNPIYASLHRQKSYDDWAPQKSVSPIESWKIGAGPPTAQPPSRIEAPYHTPLYIPQGPRTAPMKYQTSYTLTAPPSPPDSRSPSSVQPSPPPPAPPAAALPGTMSSRERSQSRSRAQKRKAGSKHEKAESTSKFGSKFKSAFKDMFKRDPVDDRDFEHIGNRHWTEEDY